MEDAFQRPLYRLACMILANELPLRHFLAKLDGKTVGLLSFAGPLGKLLFSYEKLAIVKFVPAAKFNLEGKCSNLTPIQMQKFLIYPPKTTHPTV